jgi:hypothetical protein
MASQMIHAQRTLNLVTLEAKEGIEETIPTRDIEEVSDGLIVTYCFENVLINDDILFPDASFLYINGFNFNMNSGEPAIPFRQDTFTIPLGVSVSVSVIDSSYIEMPLTYSPARPARVNGSRPAAIKSVAPYKGFCPKSIISSTRDDSYRGQPLLDVCFAPVQYNYEENKVRIFKEIKYKLTYKQDISLKGRATKSVKLVNDSFLNNVTLNGTSSLKESKTRQKAVRSYSPLSNEHYLIISVPKYADAVNRFAKWKGMLGYTVHVEMQQSWTPTSIKSTVTSIYESSNYSLTHLLIIGGHSDVPAENFTRNVGYGTYNIITDLHYGCLSSGYTPDIHRGRIPVNTLEEANTVIDKIINYERYPTTDTLFYRKGLNCAYFEDEYLWQPGSQTPNYSFRDGCEDNRFVETSERIRSYVQSKGKNVNRVYYAKNNVTPEFWSQYQYSINYDSIPSELRKPEFAWDGDYNDINSIINNGAFYVLLSDHGDIQELCEPNYNVNNIASLNNGNKLPVVFSICCWSGRFCETNCFAESFLKKANGGCVGIIAATERTKIPDNDALAESMFDAIWPNPGLLPTFPFQQNNNPISATPTPTYQLGQIFDQGIKRMCSIMGRYNRDATADYNAEIYHYFGDPSMQIYTDTPTPFTNASVTKSNGTISVSTGGEYARISFYNIDSGLSGFVDGYSATYPDNTATIISISAHNKIPYIYDNSVLYIQNETITTNTEYTSRNILVGTHVTDDKSQGPVVFQSGNTILRGRTVELHPGTQVNVGAQLEIEIGNY